VLDRSITAPLTSSPGGPIDPEHTSPNAGQLLGQRKSGILRKRDPNQDDDSTPHAEVASQGIGLGLGEELSPSMTLPAGAPLGQPQGFMNRFRQTSKSIKGNKKLWGSGKFKSDPSGSSTSFTSQTKSNLESEGLLVPSVPVQRLVQQQQQQQQQQLHQESGSEYSSTVKSLSQAALQHGSMFTEPVPPAPSSTTESNRSSTRRLSITSAALLSGNFSGPRTPSPTTVPFVTDGNTSVNKKKEKEKRSMFGFGRRKSNIGLGGF